MYRGNALHAVPISLLYVWYWHINSIISRSGDSLADSHSSLLTPDTSPWQSKRRRASTFHEGDARDDSPSPRWRKRGSSFHETRSVELSSDDRCSTTTDTATESLSFPLPPPCTCPYFGDKQIDKSPPPKPAEVKIVPSDKLQVANKLSLESEQSSSPAISPIKKPSIISRTRAGSNESSSNSIVVTWESRRGHRRGISQFADRKSPLKTHSLFRFQYREHEDDTTEQPIAK